MPSFLSDIQLNQLSLLSARIENRSSAPGSPLEGQIYVDTTTHTLRYYNGTGWIILGRLDQVSAPTADVDLNSHKIVNLAAPTGASDAARLSDVNAVREGLAFKDSVRAATTANGTLASAYENGDTLDGVTLATGDRILLKNQTAGAENGIYTVNASGAPTRATDADTGAEILGAVVPVEEGTVNADTMWMLTTNAAITLGTTSLSFSQFGTGLATPVSVANGGTGDSTLTAHGVLLGEGTSAVAITAAGATGTVLRGAGASADPTFGAVNLGTDVTSTLPVANGGTASSTAAAARTALGTVGAFAATIGDGVATSIDVTHNLGTRDVQVQCWKNASTWDLVYPDVQAATTSKVTLIFATAPATNAYRVVVMAIA